MNGLSIIATSDGSHTIKSQITGDTYHSIHGAVQESNHVFIQSGLQFILGQTHTKKIRILEVGFGTGLNAYLTLQSVSNNKVIIEYTALEPFPLGENLINALNYPPAGDLNFTRLHEISWDMPSDIAPNFSLTKRKKTIQAIEFSPASFELVYYDAFAPNSQPEMWTLEIFKKIKSLMSSPSVFVTYCAKGQVKRDLKSAGFMVESIPGPPGKREMVRAVTGII